jgi:hypothetical protein
MITLGEDIPLLILNSGDIAILETIDPSLSKKLI